MGRLKPERAYPPKTLGRADVRKQQRGRERNGSRTCGGRTEGSCCAPVLARDADDSHQQIDGLVTADARENVLHRHTPELGYCAEEGA